MRATRTLAIGLLLLIALGSVPFLPAPIETASALDASDITWTFTDTGVTVADGRGVRVGGGDSSHRFVLAARASQSEVFYSTDDWSSSSDTESATHTYLDDGGGLAYGSSNTVISYSADETSGCLSALYGNDDSWTHVEVLGSGSTAGTTCNGNTGEASHVDVDPDGTFTYAGMVSTDGVIYADSSDGGATWSNHVRINSAATGVGISISAPTADDRFVTWWYGPTTRCLLGTSTNGGSTWATSNIATGQSNAGCASDFKDGQTGILLKAEGTDVIQWKTTDGGSSWTSTTAVSNVSPGVIDDVVHLGGSLWASGYSKEAGAGTTDFVFMLSDDDGATWTTDEIRTDQGSAAEYTLTWNEDRGRLYFHHLDGSSNQIQGESSQVEGFGPEGCQETETCAATTTAETTFRDIRTSYTQEPFVFVREDGDEFGSPDATGRLIKYDEDLSAITTTHPCTGGSDGTTPWEYTPEGHFGLATTADERVAVSCLVFVTNDPEIEIRSRVKVLDNTTLEPLLTVDWTKAETSKINPDWSIRRMDAGFAQTIGLTEYDEDAYTIDSQTVAIKACDTTGTVVGIGVDPTTNRSATISDQGLKVWPATPVELCQVTVSSGGVTGTKVALYQDTVFVGRSSDVRRYTWSAVDGFTLTHTNSSLGLSNDLTANIRLSKDGDYLVHWTGSTLLVQNATDLSAISGPHSLSGGTINGCDMDLLNNFVYCVTDSTAHRIAVHADVPTVLGHDKDGYTTPGNGTLGDSFDGETNLFTPPAESGVALPDTFLGTDTSGGAAIFGDTGFAYFIGILIVAGTAAAFSMLAASAGVIAVGAFVGLVLATALKLIPLFWSVLLGIIGIAVLVFFFARRG